VTAARKSRVVANRSELYLRGQGLSRDRGRTYGDGARANLRANAAI